MQITFRKCADSGKQDGQDGQAEMEKGELRPEVVVDCELREGEAMIV